MRRPVTKRQFLVAAGAWNPRARMVASSLFCQSDFFDPRDKVQVKYEMLRSHAVDAAAVTVASRQFGYSREAFYTALEAQRERGIVALADGKRGPKQPHKLTPEVQKFLRRAIERDADVSAQELAQRVAVQFNLSVHHRSIERFRSADAKKNRTRRQRRRSP